MCIVAQTSRVNGVCHRHGWLQGVQLLLAADAAVDVPNKRVLTALGEAVAAGHLAVAQALIEAGADVRWRASG